MINAGLITIIGVVCFFCIQVLKQKNRLSSRSFKVLVTVGPFSWAAQMGLLALMANADHLVITIATALAIICFWMVMLAVRDERISGSAAAQAILWGELVFPLVLVSLLPNGAWTLFSFMLSLVH